MKLFSLPSAGKMGLLLTAGAVVVALITWLQWGFFNSWEPLAADFAVFWEASRIEVARIYHAEKFFVYPPPAILLFKPLALISFWPGYVAWTLLSALIFFIAVRAISDATIAAISLVSAASLQGLLLGQTPMLLSAGILLAFTVAGPAGGALLGVILVIKPQLLVLAPLALIVRRDWKMVLGLILGSSFTVGVSLMVFGIQPWLDWIDGLPRFHQAVIDLRVILSTITPASLAERFGLPPLPFLLCGIAVATYATIVLAPRLDGVELVALIVGAGILAVPYALTHDLVAVMPACVAYLLRRPGLKALPAMAVFAGILIPLAIIIVACWMSVRQRLLDIRSTSVSTV